MSDSNEKVSLREFGRFIGVSDTAVRKKVFDPEKNPTGPLKASLCKNPNNDRPMLYKFIALAEWTAAGLTINNPDIKPGAKPETQEATPAKEATQEPGANNSTTVSLKELNTLNPPGTVPPPERRALSAAGNIITDDMDIYDAKKYKAVFEAGKLELEYRQKLGELVEKSEVYKTLFEFGQEMRNQLTQIPARIVPFLLACDTEREAKDALLKEIEEVMISLLEGPKEKAKDNDESDSDSNQLDA
jgi:hypothetical protein